MGALHNIVFCRQFQYFGIKNLTVRSLLDPKQSILVIGATGYFGRLLLNDLLQHTACNLIAASRSEEALRQLQTEYAQAPARLTTMRVDLRDSGSIASAIKQCNTAVCAAGPFQTIPLDFARQCITTNVPYIDLSDYREYVMKVRQISLASMPSSAVCTGWSAMPALSAVMTRIAAQQMDALQEIYIALAPGNRAPRGQSTVSSLLDSVGKRFALFRNNSWTEVTGWSEQRMFKFPAPIGRRQGYLVDVPEHELFPAIFSANTVEFRVSPELGFFNAPLVALSWLRDNGLVSNWLSLAPLFRAAMAAFGALGHDWGAIGVEVHGSKQSKKLCRRVTMLAEKDGQRIPVMPATIMCQRIMSGGRNDVSGLIPLDSWIDYDQLNQECRVRGYKLFVEDD